MAAPYFCSTIGPPGNAARECVALLVLLVLFGGNRVCSLLSNCSPFYPREGHSVYMGKNKRHLVSWCGASVHTGFPEIPRLSSFQEDANFKIEYAWPLTHPVLTDARGRSLDTVQPCLPCWYLFVHVKFDLKVYF